MAKKPVDVPVEEKKEPTTYEQILQLVNRMRDMLLRLDKEYEENRSAVQLVKKTADLYEKKLEAFEESLLFIMHNIKKNQFLYAHYPDDWVKDYLDVKKGLKYENERMSNL